ncbi:MAG: PilN domain-containing protein, partial [Planctomycetota bacterium]
LAADDAGALACATVRDTPLGASSSLVEAIDDALATPADRLRERLPAIKRSDALVFVCPSSLVSTRPFALTARTLPAAREDLVASVATLFPLTPDDARLGIIDLAPTDDPSDDAAPRGALLAASAHALRPWLEHIHAVTGRTPDAVLAPAHCLPALGFQNEASARVLESLGPGETVEHPLRFGLPAELARTPDAASPEPAHALPGASPANSGRALRPAELALAGALAPTASRTRIAPLQGELPTPRARWLLPAACLALASVLAFLALRAPEARTRALVRDIEARNTSIEPDVQRVSAVRREALALQALLDDALAPTLARWSPTTPDLEAAHDALPEGVWLSSLALTETELRIAGVARDPRAVLRAVESSSAFEGAAFTMPPAPVPAVGPDSEPEPGESFRLTARRSGVAPRNIRGDDR